MAQNNSNSVPAASNNTKVGCKYEDFEATPERVIVAIVYFLLSFSGLAIYLVFVSIVLYYKSTTFKSAFYTMAVALAAADIPVLVVEVFFAVPFLFICDNNIKYVFNLIAGGTINVTYFSLSSQILLISINRFFAVCVNHLYDTVFSVTNVYIMMGFIALYSVTRTILLYLTGCRVLFVGYSFTYVCPPAETEYQRVYGVIEPTLSYVVVALVAVMYAIIFVCVKIQGKKLAASGKASIQHKRERNLMIQFIFVVVILVIYETSFFVVPAMITSGILSGNQGSIIINIFAILNSAIPPVMAILFASDIKAILFNRGKVTTGATTMATGRSVVVSKGPTNNQNHLEELEL